MADRTDFGDSEYFGEAYASARPYNDYGADAATHGENSSPVIARPYVWRDPKTIPLRPWIFGYWLMRRLLALLFAAGGSGKTKLIAAMALSLASGRSLLGKKVWDGPKRVWIWNLEDEQEELDREIAACGKLHGISEQEVAGNLFLNCAMEGDPLCTARLVGGQFTILEPAVEGIVAQCRERRIDVLVVDPFVSSHEVDENANVYIDKVARRWARVAKEANIAVLLAHHTTKLAPGIKTTVMSGRGASSLKDAARMALVINKMDADEAKKLQVDPAERWRFFNVQDDKHSRAPADKADWFRLESVYLDNGGIEGGDGVGVVEPWSPPNMFDGLPVNALATVQANVADGSWRKDVRSPEWVGRLVADVLGLDIDDDNDKQRVKDLLKVWFKNEALVEVTDKDDTRQSRKFVRVGNAAPV